MALLAFQKPDKIILQKATDFEGTFEFAPLEPGFGATVGNALRRVLLSSLEGFAISEIKIGGVDHEFSHLPIRKDKHCLFSCRRNIVIPGTSCWTEYFKIVNQSYKYSII